MNIISQKTEFVNNDNEKFRKWTEKKSQNLIISEKMVDAGFKKRGYLMRECGTFLQYKMCPDCGKSFISSTNLCRDRLCPTCAWRLSLKRFAEMCSVINTLSELDLSCVGFLTLTVKNCKPENLRYTLKKMNEDWNRMLSGRKLSGMLLGWAKSIEITYNEEHNTFHPHFHVIVLFDNFLGEGETNRFFRGAWSKACRLPYEPITDFRMIDGKKETTSSENDKIYNAILETFKYSVKDSELADMPMNTFRQFVTAIHGLRMASYGGVIKQARKELGMKDNDEEEGEGEIGRTKCDCGAELLKMVCEWSFSEKQYKTIAL